MRWHVSMNVLFHRHTESGVQETEGGFRTQIFPAMDPADIDYTALRADLNREVEQYTNVGSWWTMSAIIWFIILLGDYRPLTGSSYIPTPKAIVHKHAVISVHNPSDEMWFLWAVLSALHPVDDNGHRVSKYQPYVHTLDVTGLKCPMPANQVATFERNNSTVSVNVYDLAEDEKEIIPRYVTKYNTRERHWSTATNIRWQVTLSLNERNERTC